MKAHIFRPTRTAMQSGQANTREWIFEFIPESSLFIDPLMGWSGMKDTTRQIQIAFDSQEEAIAYAKRNGLDFQLAEPKMRVIKPKSYAANFAFNKVI